MQYEWDDEKARSNLERHGIDFMDAAWFEWEAAKIAEDCRHDYGEKRFMAHGYILNRLVVLVFTMRGDIVRIISLRKANKREVKNYGS